VKPVVVGRASDPFGEPDMSTHFVTNTEFPFEAPQKGQLRFLLSFAIQAPSGHNTQPWLFRLNEDHVDLLADRTRALPVVDPYDRELAISCGAALDHLEVAARNYGRELSIEICPESADADLLARISMGNVVTDELSNDLFTAIPKRRTNRTQFEGKQIPDALVDRCEAIATDLGVELILIKDRIERLNVAELVAEADRVQFADHRFRRELASWVHSRRRSSQDGMSGDAFGMPDMLSPIGALVIRTFDMGKGIAAGDRKKIVDGSPMLAVFSTSNDDVRHWIAAGRALSRVLLTLAAAGATASYLNQPIEVESLRPQLRETVSCEGSPQLLLRFGYGTSLPPSVRRSVDEVLV